MGRRRQSSRRGGRKGFFVLTVAFMVLTGIFVETRIPEIKDDIQQATLRKYALEQIAKAVKDTFPREMTAGGEQALVLDTYLLGETKSKLTTALEDSLNGTVTAWVPIGNFTGLSVLNGVGFSVPITFHVDGAVLVEFESVFESAGINRTRYGLQMRVTAELYSSSTSFSDVITVSTTYPVYESVTDGEVPELFAGWDT